MKGQQARRGAGTRWCVSSARTPSAAWVGSKAGAAGAGRAQPSRPGGLGAELLSVPGIRLPIEIRLGQVSWACFGMEVGGCGRWAERQVGWGDMLEGGSKQSRCSVL